MTPHAAAVAARTNAVAALRRRGLTYDQIAARLRVGPDAVWKHLHRAGMVANGPHRRIDYAAVRRLILSGRRHADIAADLGVSVYAVHTIAQVTGTRSPLLVRRDVPCPACGGERGRHTFRCDACERRKYRNGLCPCGRPKRFRRPCECGAVHPYPRPLRRPRKERARAAR